MTDTTYRQRRRKPMSEINVVPYIDVMLVLLVIFMITTPLLSQGVKVDLPEAEAKPVESAELETLVVTVDRDGRFYLDNKVIEKSALQKKCARFWHKLRKPRCLFGVTNKLPTVLWSVPWCCCSRVARKALV